MKSFISEIGDYIIDNHKENIADLCIVFPNRRAGVFLKKDLSEKIKKTFLSPYIFSIDDFIIDLSDIYIADKLKLIEELYKIHILIEKDNSRGFDEFIDIAENILHDFNEIDMYMVDATHIFSYLSEAKTISLWNPQNSELSVSDKQYLRFYRLLNIYYKELNKTLKKQKIHYQGGIYRYVSENISHLLKTKNWKKIIFAGFNALTASEEKIFKYIANECDGTILWDTDKYYVENNYQEAGKFFRIYKNQYPDFKWLNNHFAEKNKKIEIIGSPMKIGQIKYSIEILEKLKIEEKESCALILNDEELIEPLILTLPESVNKVNVTMGLAFNNTLLYNLIENILQLHENRIKFIKNETNIKGFYFKDILQVIQHPYIINNYDTKDAINYIKTSNKIFYHHNEIIKLINKEDQNISFYNIFKYLICYEDIIEILIKFSEDFHNKLIINTDANKLKIEYFNSLSLILFRFRNLSDEVKSKITISSFRKLFVKYATTHKIALVGEPLEGIQVMGILESRNLDFNNVILLSMNEGIIPSGKNYNTFLPFDIRKNFNLPDNSDKDAIYAYHFYRLIQKAENIFLLYVSEPDEFSGGDKSRFLYQIINELPNYNKNIEIIEKNLVFPIPQKNFTKEIIYYKDNFAIEKLKNMATKGFSASALNDFISCSLKFYFKYIEEVLEPDVTEEIIEANTLGSVIHETLAILYKPYINKIMQIDDLQKMMEIADDKLYEVFRNNFSDEDINFGINYLIVNIAKQFINNFINNEINHLNKLIKNYQHLTIKMLEQKMDCILDIDSSVIPIVKLKGFVDRVDSIDNIVRIIDYKTGFVDVKDLKIKEKEQIIEDAKYAKLFQLMIYALLFSKEHPENQKKILPCIISFRNLLQGYLNIEINNEIHVNSVIHEFEKLLQKLFKEIFDDKKAFTMTLTKENCSFCSYKEICER